MKSLALPAFALLLAVSPLSLPSAVHAQTAAAPAATALETPGFLRVGEWYVAQYFEPSRPVHFRMLEAGRGGWIKAQVRDEVMWLNTNAVLLIKPGTPE